MCFFHSTCHYFKCPKLSVSEISWSASSPWRTWDSHAIFFRVVRPVSHKREKTEINDRQRENDAEERPLSLVFFHHFCIFFFLKKGRSQWGRREWVPTGIERFFFVSVFGSAQTTSDGQQKQTAVNLFWPNWNLFFFGLGAEMSPRGDQPRRIEWNDCNTSQWSVLLRHARRWRWLSEGCFNYRSFWSAVATFWYLMIIDWVVHWSSLSCATYWTQLAQRLERAVYVANRYQSPHN